MCLVGIWELAGAFARMGITLAVTPLYVGAIGMVTCAWWLGSEGMLFALYITVFVCAAWRLLDRRQESRMSDVVSTTFTAAYVPFLASFVVLMLGAWRNPWVFVVFELMVIANDTGGWAAGVLFGKHPMAPALSPKKSWEGFAGSALTAVGVGTVGLWWLGADWWWGIIAGISIAFVGTMGDLTESLIKREAGLKDMSKILPGHGGVLDRVDALLMSAPVAYFIFAWALPGISWGVQALSQSTKGRSGSDRRERDEAVAASPIRRSPRREVRPTDQPPEGATHKDAKPVLSFTAKRRGKAPSHLADLDAAGRKQVLKDLGLPAFRADQLSRHYFTHFEADPERMSDIPAGMRAQVREALLPTLVSKVVSLEADGGRTIKDLWRLYDGAQVESVLMRYPQRTTLCVSSQAGCGMACPFCATGQMGLTRNLSTAEIVDQVRYAQAACRDGVLAGGPTTLSNIVFMGMGEPLANYKTVIGALHRLIDPAPEGFGMSARNITVSTVGLVPAIRKLAGEGMPVTLAVSLHAPDDDLRDELIPINSRWKVGELLDAARAYFLATGRRVSIEYALIKDMNDQEWRAQLLADELNRRGHGWVHVNPIPLNPTPGSILDGVDEARPRRFRESAA